MFRWGGGMLGATYRCIAAAFATSHFADIVLKSTPDSFYAVTRSATRSPPESEVPVPEARHPIVNKEVDICDNKPDDDYVPTTTITTTERIDHTTSEVTPL